MLEIHNLHKSYNNLKVLDGISLEIDDNDFVGLVGPNGVGKSTLIGCITGIVNFYEGDILFNNKSIKKYPYETKRNIGVCFQDNIFDRFFNIYDTIRFNAMYHGISRKDSFIKCNEALEALKLSDKKACFGTDLSGGMKKRFQIAQSIVHNPNFLILDEPSAGVDLELKEDIYNLLRLFISDKSRSILLTSHYIEEIKLLCNKVIFLKDGKVIKKLNKNEYDFSKDNMLEDLYKQFYFTKG